MTMNTIKWRPLAGRGGNRGRCGCGVYPSYAIHAPSIYSGVCGGCGGYPWGWWRWRRPGIPIENVYFNVGILQPPPAQPAPEPEADEDDLTQEEIDRYLGDDPEP